MKKNVVQRVKTLLTAVVCAGVLAAVLTGCQNLTDKGGGVKSSEKQLIEFGFGKIQDGELEIYASGNIDEAAKTVAVEVPHGTDVKDLKAVFTVSVGAFVSVDGKAQVSSVTPNDFTSPVKYTVKAEDGSSSDYTVNIKVAAAKKMLSFKFEKANNSGVLNADVPGTIDESSKQIILIVPHGTNLDNLVATFTSSDGTQVLVSTTQQQSGKTPNNFTHGVKAYYVKAQDGSQQRYVVQVEVAPAEGQKLSGNKITSFGFEKKLNPELPVDYVKGTISNKIKVINIVFPVGTKPETVKNLIPTFTISAKAQIKHNGTPVQSTKTSSDFYHHLGANYKSKKNMITITAENGDTAEYYLLVEILLPKAETAEVQKYFGSYYGKTDATSAIGENKVVVVLEEKKVTLYSTAKNMSMDYVNVKWEKNGDAYACIAYKRTKEQIKVHGLADFPIEEKDGKITLITNIMGQNVTAEKGADFVWTEGSEYQPVTKHF